jgi:hypothetical protein
MRIATFFLTIGALAGWAMVAGAQESVPKAVRVLLLHHSTGGVIWSGGVPAWFAQYNATHGTNYQIAERIFPQDAPYGWQNYPYDYWNIWVEHAGDSLYMEEPTLERLTAQYDLIIWKHCYPVSNIEEDTGKPDIRSREKRLENYLLQYEALKAKMRQFPQNRFVVWTGAALVQSSTTEENALRAQRFFAWVRDTWDEPGDNIFVWDLHTLQTGGGLYLSPGNAAAADDSHPSEAFARQAAPLLCQRIVEVIENRGDQSPLTGEPTPVAEQNWGQIKAGNGP